MAYMHQTALHSVNNTYRQHYKLFSPLTYLEFIDLFKNLACKIGRDEKVSEIYHRKVSMDFCHQLQLSTNSILDHLFVKLVHCQNIRKCKTVAVQLSNSFQSGRELVIALNFKKFV